MTTLQLIDDHENQVVTLPPELRLDAHEVIATRVGESLILSPKSDGVESPILQPTVPPNDVLDYRRPPKKLDLKPKGPEAWAKFEAGVGTASDDFMLDRDQPAQQVRDLDFE